MVLSFPLLIFHEVPSNLVDTFDLFSNQTSSNLAALVGNPVRSNIEAFLDNNTYHSDALGIMDRNLLTSNLAQRNNLVLCGDTYPIHHDSSCESDSSIDFVCVHQRYLEHQRILHNNIKAYDECFHNLLVSVLFSKEVL